MESIKEGDEVIYTNPVSNNKQKVMIITIGSGFGDSVTVIPMDSVDPNEHFFCSSQELSLE